MKLILNERARKFKDFLDLFNLLYQKKESKPVIELSLKLVDIRFKLENTIWDDDSETWGQISSYRDLIDEETRKLFADNRELCSFLFGTESIYKVSPKPIEGQNAMPRKALGEIICEAIASLQNFIDNYQTLPKLISNIERNRIVAELLGNIGTNKLFSTSWTGIGIVSYLLTDKGQLEINLNQNDFFYGYRDFERIFRCKWCKKYYLARRKDANYCSKTCRYSYNQNERLKNPIKRKEHLELKKKYYQRKLKKK